jgi:hypothetical protein
MQRLVVICIALVTLLAVSATPSSASAEKLILTEGATTLQPGDEFWLEGDSVLSVEASGVECGRRYESTELDVSVLTNSKGTDKLQLKHLEGGELPAPCRSFTGNVDVTVESLGEVVKLKPTGKATVGPVVVQMFFEHERYKETTYEDFSCIYARNTLAGTNNATTTAQALGVSFAGELSLKPSLSSEKAKQLCPGKAEISLSVPSAEGAKGGVIEERIAP